MVLWYPILGLYAIERSLIREDVNQDRYNVGVRCIEFFAMGV